MSFDDRRTHGSGLARDPALRTGQGWASAPMPWRCGGQSPFPRERPGRTSLPFRGKPATTGTSPRYPGLKAGAGRPQPRERVVILPRTPAGTAFRMVLPLVSPPSGLPAVVLCISGPACGVSPVSESMVVGRGLLSTSGGPPSAPSPEPAVLRTAVASMMPSEYIGDAPVDS